MIEKEKYVWMNGSLVEWDRATVHILTHSLHYGLGTFEGIRSYALADGGQAVFRLRDHIRRLFDSCHIAGMSLRYSQEQLVEACKGLLRANGLREGYLRPIVYFGYGSMGVLPKDNPVDVAIAAWKWGKYLGPEALEKGIRCQISSYIRYHPNTMMTSGKITGNYTTSVLAKVEAVRNGFDEAILLDIDGYVAEGSGENIFIVRDGRISTPPLMTILPGVTRDTIMILARELGYAVEERRFSREELYIADEVFFTGTAAEVTPIREVDARRIGNGRPGPVTRRLQELFFQVVTGRHPSHKDWLDGFELGEDANLRQAARKGRPARV